MISDNQTQLSGATAADGTRIGQAITATAISTNVLDLRNAATPALVDDGVSAPLYLVVQITQGFNNLTSLAITLESDSNSNMTTSPVVLAGQVVPLANLTAGSIVFSMPVPQGDWKRYMAVRYTVVGTNPTTGAVIAQLTPSRQRNIAFASRVTLDS